MQPEAPKKKFAWQPLTPSGMARFAGAKLGRLLVVQLVFALLGSAVITRVFYTTWVPVINAAVQQLPARGEIRHAELQMPAAQPVILAENRFFGLSIDPKHAGDARSAAHVHAEFGAKDFGLYSVAGYVLLKYPPGYRIVLNHDETVPAWAAWRPPVIAAVGGLAIVWQFLSWMVLQTLYFLPVWVGSFFAGKQLTLSGSWKLAGAALTPGAVFFTISIGVYGLGWLDLIQFGAAAAIHLLIGWVLLPFAVAKCPRAEDKESAKANPFGTTRETASQPKDNPFSH